MDPGKLYFSISRRRDREWLCSDWISSAVIISSEWSNHQWDIWSQLYSNFSQSPSFKEIVFFERKRVWYRTTSLLSHGNLWRDLSSVYWLGRDDISSGLNAHQGNIDRIPWWHASIDVSWHLRRAYWNCTRRLWYGDWIKGLLCQKVVSFYMIRTRLFEKKVPILQYARNMDRIINHSHFISTGNAAEYSSVRKAFIQ